MKEIFKPNDKFIVTLNYHPQEGKDDEFLALWNKTIYQVASGMGARIIAIYHKKDTDHYVATGHFSSSGLAKKFLISSELRKATDKLNKISSKPATCDLLKIIDEKAA